MDKLKLTLIIRGGVLQDILSNRPSQDEVEITVIDYDEIEADPSAGPFVAYPTVVTRQVAN